ncbi:MAG: hypothetical protein EA351_02620 [Gemmatimonadales bacterium]|nr:MAG: hypothetical protein EA351_02620 [Gemmatimonadales bacterium]
MSSSGDDAAGGGDGEDGDRGNRPGAPRWLVAGGGAAVGLALLIAVGIALLPASRDIPEGAPGDLPAAGETGALDPAGSDPPVVSEEPDPAGPPGDPAGTERETTPPPTDPDPTPPPATDPVPTDSPAPAPAETPPPEAEAPPFPGGHPGIDVSGAVPRDLLGVQAGYALATDDPSPEVLRAVRDTAYAVWSDLTMNRADSALAAYLVGFSMIPVGDSVAGVAWLEEAVRLNPLSSYVNFLELHRGGGGR